jgi:hypothetical protein
MSAHQELLEDYERTKPEDTDFRQQRLRSWQPLLIPSYTILTFIILGCIFLPVGFGIWDGSSEIVEYEVRYDNKPCDTLAPLPCVKSVEIPITESIQSPIYVYYKLTNFFQNHRRYVKSRSDTQLNGDLSLSVSACDPLEEWSDKVLYPCGLISNSHFNDTFVGLVRPKDSTTPVLLTEWTEKGISWNIDRDTKFIEKFPGETTLPADSGMTRDGPNGQLPYLTDEHFMNWMRPAAFPTFRKLYAFINRDFQKDDTIIVEIEDNFNTAQYDGTKSVIVSNANWLGGKNYTLAYLYIGCGAFCFFMALVVLIKQCACPRKLGHMATAVDLRRVQNTHQAD